jgi:iron complex transport system substrate-binding protein
LGGVRSGKSRYAAELARAQAAPITLIATARVLDDEMAARVAAHRACRPADWRVVEEPVQLAAALTAAAGSNRTVIVDCLTLWLTNLLCDEDESALAREPAALLQALANLPGNCVLVSNEVGLGVIPANALARRFADEAGVLHQKLAAICDRVVLMAAGLPLTFKALLVFLFCCAFSLNGAVAQAAVLELRDDLQREARFAHPPQRIVSMLPSLTETVCALDACERIVGTDRFSNWPVRVQALPKAGGLDDAEVEMIVSLRPDLVLLGRSQHITERLGELGIASFALETRSYADIARTVRILGEILGLRERAALLNQTLADGVRDVARRAADRPQGKEPTVYFEVDVGPYAAGSSSFIGELLALVGARNIVTSHLGPFPKLNPEYVVRHDPQVIFISPAEAPHLAERPGWDKIRAIREHRLCSFTPEVRDTIVRPGPRVAQGMSAMAQCLWPAAP